MSVYLVNFFDIRAIPPPDSSLQNALVALTVVNVYFLIQHKLHKAPSLSLSCCIAGMSIVLGSDETAWRWKSHGRAGVPKISGRGGQYC